MAEDIEAKNSNTNAPRGSNGLQSNSWSQGQQDSGDESELLNDNDNDDVGHNAARYVSIVSISSLPPSATRTIGPSRVLKHDTSIRMRRQRHRETSLFT